MKVLKIFGKHDLRVADAQVPEPGEGYALIKVRASGICGSDKWMWEAEGEQHGVSGHEVAGEVVKLGPGVTSLAEGDRVMVNNVVGCGECAACRAGAFVLCASRDGSKDVNNGFGEYLVAPARNCARLLPGLDFVDGALIMDNFGTPYGAIKRGKVGKGTDVIVNGCGPIGQAAVILCKAFGAYVIAVDPVGFRRDTALKNGADRAFAPGELPEAVKKCTNGFGADAALECSGNGSAYISCLDSLRFGGNLVSVGEGATFALRPSDHLIHRTLGILGTWYSTMPDASEIMQMALQKRIDPRAFLTRTLTLEEVPDMFGKIVNCEDGLLKCVIVFD